MSTPPRKPSRKDRTRPAEILVLSAILAVFVGLVVLMSTRALVLSLVFCGVSFIVALVVFAMLALASNPRQGGGSGGAGSSGARSSSDDTTSH